MKSFWKESLELLGARVTETAVDELQVHPPDGSAAKRLLGGGGEHRLVFAAKPGVHARLIGADGLLLDSLKLELSKRGSVRHAVYPTRFQFNRKDVSRRFEVFAGNVRRFSVRSIWLISVRCHLIITFSGDEYIEEMISVEIPSRGPPRIIEAFADAAAEVSPVEKPPLSRRCLQAIIEKGLGLAEKIAFEKAADRQSECIKGLYTTLNRLRTYYGQLKAENGKAGDCQAAMAYEAEYRRRRIEELEHARMRAKIRLIALETLACPAKEIKWRLERNAKFREACAVVSLFNGETVDPLQCEICGRQTDSIGMAASNQIVCRRCHSRCEICKGEIIAENILKDHTCATCGRHVCLEHSLRCEICKVRVCQDHVFYCRQGCRICRNCIRHCPDCGNEVIWCRDHVVVNSRGDAACRSHAVYCIACRQYHPTQKADACSVCGQTLCFECRRFCADCHRVLCPNHIQEGRCSACRLEMENREIRTQMRIFRKDLARRLKIHKY